MTKGEFICNQFQKRGLQDSGTRTKDGAKSGCVEKLTAQTYGDRGRQADKAGVKKGETNESRLQRRHLRKSLQQPKPLFIEFVFMF